MKLESIEKFIIPVFSAIVTMAVAIGWYRAKFQSAEKRIKALEIRCDSMERDTGRKIDDMNKTLIEIKTLVDLLVDGRIGGAEIKKNR